MQLTSLSAGERRESEGGSAVTVETGNEKKA
jgi:hypothetical protein